VRLVAGKKAKRKCPKGWRKVGWTKAKGNLAHSVYSADREFVGKLVGAGFVPGGLTTLNILRNGGIWTYTFGGLFFPSSASFGDALSFKTPDFTGPGYAPFSGLPKPGEPGILRGPVRRSEPRHLAQGAAAHPLTGCDHRCGSRPRRIRATR
jgi:hypothetical protein